MGERCTECGDHTSVPYCPGCRIKELDERERETIARVVKWLRAEGKRADAAGLALGEYYDEIAKALKKGDWKGGDDER